MHNQTQIFWSVLVVAAAACTVSLKAADPQSAPVSTKEPAAASSSPASNQKKIDVNKATVEELETLPGVGAGRYGASRRRYIRLEATGAEVSRYCSCTAE